MSPAISCHLILSRKPTPPRWWWFLSGPREETDTTCAWAEMGQWGFTDQVWAAFRKSNQGMLSPRPARMRGQIHRHHKKKLKTQERASCGEGGWRQPRAWWQEETWDDNPTSRFSSFPCLLGNSPRNQKTKPLTSAVTHAHLGLPVG